MKTKEEEIKKLKAVIQNQKEVENKKLKTKYNRDQSEEDTRIRKDLSSVEYDNPRKMSKMSESIDKPSFEWNIPKRLPKKDQIVWIEKDRLPHETKVLKTADKNDGNKFVVFETKNPQKVWTIEPEKHVWQYEKPMCNQSPNASASDGQISSTPEDQKGAAAGALRNSFMAKLNPKK